MQAANGKQSRKGKNVLHFSIVIDISFTEIPKHVVELPDEFIGVGLRYTQLVRNFFRPDESVLHMDSSFLLI